MRAQCVQSVLSSAKADAVISILSVGEALLPAPCRSVGAFTFPPRVFCFPPAAREVPHSSTACQLKYSMSSRALLHSNGLTRKALSPCMRAAQVIHFGVEGAALIGAAVMHTYSTPSQIPDAIAAPPPAHAMLSQAHPPGAVAKTLVGAISTVQCFLPPVCSPVRAFILPHWAGHLHPAFIEFFGSILHHFLSQQDGAGVCRAVLAAAV